MKGKGVVVYPDGQATVRVTKKRILSARHMSMMANDDDCDYRMSFLLMEIKMYDGKIIHVRMFEKDGTYTIETWFDRLREMKANDKIEIVINPKRGKNGLFQDLDGPHHKLYDGEFLSASIKI